MDGFLQVLQFEIAYNGQKNRAENHAFCHTISALCYNSYYGLFYLLFDPGGFIILQFGSSACNLFNFINHSELMREKKFIPVMHKDEHINVGLVVDSFITNIHVLGVLNLIMSYMAWRNTTDKFYIDASYNLVVLIMKQLSRNFTCSLSKVLVPRNTLDELFRQFSYVISFSDQFLPKEKHVVLLECVHDGVVLHLDVNGKIDLLFMGAAFLITNFLGVKVFIDPFKYKRQFHVRSLRSRILFRRGQYSESTTIHLLRQALVSFMFGGLVIRILASVPVSVFLWSKQQVWIVIKAEDTDNPVSLVLIACSSIISKCFEMVSLLPSINKELQLKPMKDEGKSSDDDVKFPACCDDILILSALIFLIRVELTLLYRNYSLVVT